MRTITIRRLKPQTDVSVAAAEVDALIQEREAGAKPKTLKGAALGAWYAKLTGPTAMWIATYGQVEVRQLEEVGLSVAGMMHKGQFYAQRIVDKTDLLPEQQIAALKSMGQAVADHGLFTIKSLEQVEAYLTYTQSRLGATSLIVCDPRVASTCRLGTCATFKARVGTATTTVSEVVWNMDRHGNLIPRLVLVPVIIKGALISNVSGHNAAFIYGEGIGVGATVRIHYERGAAPIVDEVIGRANPEMPNEAFEWAGNHVRPRACKQLVGE